MSIRAQSAQSTFCFLAILLCGFFLPTIAGGKTESTNAAIKTNKIHIGKLEHEIQNHLEKIRQNSKQELSLLGELKQIDEKLGTGKNKLAALTKELGEQQKRLAEKAGELEQISQIRDRVRRHLEKRLHSFYVMGKTGFLNVAFSRKNLPELMLFNDAYKRMLEYDQRVISRYRATIAELTKANQEIELQKNILAGLVRQAEKEEQGLQAIRLEKTQLLTRIKSKKGLYEQAVREMQKAEHDLTTTISRLRQKKRNKKRGFLLNKGRLQGPAEGKLVVRFGEMVDNSPSKGIIIHTEENTPVVSIFTGKVIFAGYKLGYGNMVIIDHGLGYYTITAHLDDILVKNGARVLGGQQIGATGDIATLFSRGLYFEIRKDSTTLDPLKWLSANAYPKLIPLPLPTMDHVQQQNASGERFAIPVK